MNFFKFFKFSKLLSACVSFGILFSGFQTSGMERRLNFDMLGIGIRNNSGGDNESVTTEDTVASPMDGIKVKIPEHCEFCDQKVFREVRYLNSCKRYICRNDGCLQECFNKFLGLIGSESRKLDTDNIHRCDVFKENMENLEQLKKANYKFPEMDGWEIYNEDKFVDELWLSCGHSVCFCNVCASEYQKVLFGRGPRRGPAFEWVCPKCSAKSIALASMLLRPICDMEHNEGMIDSNKSRQLIENRLNDEWRDGVIHLYDGKDSVVDVVHQTFGKYPGYINPDFEFDEERFKKVDDMIKTGKKILVIDGKSEPEVRNGKRKVCSLEISKLDDYIKALIKYGRYKDIVYPVKGKLHDKIEAIAVKSIKEAIAAFKFIKDNTIIMSKERYCEILADIATIDGVEE